MADRQMQTSKMAVSENHELRNAMNVAREEMEQRAAINSTRSMVDGVPRKKGTFKITSVKLNDTADADSTDDLDESHTEMTEDYSSEILDASRATDYEQDTPSVTEEIPLNVQSVRIVTDGKEKPVADMHSRFRVVKIETTEPFHRGRWICHDFLDPLPSVTAEKSDTKVTVGEEGYSGSSSAASSIHYVHGVDDPAKNPLLAGATGTINAPTPVPEGHTVGTQDSFQPIQPASTATPTNVPTIGHLPQSQVSSQGYFSDQSQGINGVSSQMISQSHSHQSINSSLSNTDTAMSQQPQTGSIGVSTPEMYSGQVKISNPPSTQTDSSNTGIPQGIFLPNFSTASMLPGTTMAIPSPYASPVTTVGEGEKPSINRDIPTSVVNTQGPGSSTYQTYVHLGGQQIVNPSIVGGGQSESIPVKSDQKQLATESVSEAKPNSHLTIGRMNVQSGDLAGALDKDLTEIQNQTTLSPALVAAVEELHSPEEDQSPGDLSTESGSSTVAIDNKIEQAMDLVKSHLMFAVREEVEVLKEQIRDLVERMSQLEYENGILRAAASAETLALLAQPRQPPPSSSS